MRGRTAGELAHALALERLDEHGLGGVAGLEATHPELAHVVEAARVHVLRVRQQEGVVRACAGVQGCSVTRCMGVLGYGPLGYGVLGWGAQGCAWVRTGAHGCARVCTGVHGRARACKEWYGPQ